MSGVRHDQPRSPYDQFCFELLEKFRKDLPYYTNEMLELHWPEANRQLQWDAMSDGGKEFFGNKAKEDWILRPPTGETGIDLLPPLNFDPTRKDFTAVELYCEEQYDFLFGGEIPDSIAEKRQFYQEFPSLPEVQKRRLKRKAHRRNVRKAAFRTLIKERCATDFTSPAPEQKWIFIRPLGEGGYGRAYQMARLDSNENVLENMALKITDLDSHPSTWKFQMSGPNNMIREIAYHERMSALQPKYVVEFYQYRVEEEDMSYRIYMEYCPYGDLSRLIHEYRFLQIGGIPGQFLWYVFEAVASACRAMDKNFARRRGKIVHLDLNPSNVFLGFEDEEHFPVYPTPKVADFGLAVETDLNDRRNPVPIAYSGTEGYFAPENNLDMWDDNRHKMKMALGTSQIYGYTNIYQCGMVIYSMMMLRYGYRAPQHNGYNAPPAPPLAIKHPDLPYREDLIGIIYSCLLSSPNERATPEELQDVIEESIEDLAGDMATYKDRFGNYFGRDRKYPGKLLYDVNQEKLAFLPDSRAAGLT